jgi:hypothetical protein
VEKQFSGRACPPCWDAGRRGGQARRLNTLFSTATIDHCTGALAERRKRSILAESPLPVRSQRFPGP